MVDLHVGSSGELGEHLVASKISSLAPVEKLDLVKQLLAADVVNIKALRRMGCAGITPGKGVRARVWHLLLEYIPSERSRWEETLTARRAEYASFCSDFMIDPSRAAESPNDDPLNEADNSRWKSFFADLEELEQIGRDVERTHCGHAFFSAASSQAAERREALVRMLFVFAKLNPGLKYVQGMNEVAAPLFFVFSTDAASAEDAAAAEADTFFCFVRLLTLSDSRDLFCRSLDRSNSGVTAALREFMTELHAADPTVAAHLEAQKVDPHYFAFRWMTVLLAQDIERLEDVVRIWDYLLGASEGAKRALLRVCCALILRNRTALLAAEFPEIVRVLQSCGREAFDAEDAISVAASLSDRYVPH